MGKRSDLAGQRHLLDPIGAPHSLNKLGPGKFLVDVLIEGIHVTAMIDTGAMRDFISEKFVQEWKLNLNRKRVPYPLTTADGTLIASNQGMVTQEAGVTLETQGRTSKETLDVTNIGDTDVILGLPWLRKHQPRIDWTNLTLAFQDHRIPDEPRTRRGYQTVKSLIIEDKPTNVEVVCCYRLERSDARTAFEIPPEYREFGELFTDEAPEQALQPHKPWDHEIKLKPDTFPKKFKIYPLNPAQRKALDEYVDDSLAKGFIQESKSPAGYPVFYVPKPDGGLRLCVDYRQLNEITVKNAYTLPLIQELRDQLQGAKWFTKFDIPSAFHRIRIKEGDEWKTAFRTHKGHYEYLVMPFGLTNAPASFQAYINNVLREHIDVFVCVYIDDILIYSRTREEHVEHVRKVLRALQKYNLRLKPSKSEFHVQRTTFLGCIISPDGLEVDPSKVERVKEWPVPTSVKGVQAFLGFANYYRQFIRGFSGIAAPLSALTVKDKEFVWTDGAQKAFETLKQLLLTTPVLALFDSKKPCTVETDASDFALGAVLSQPGDDGRLRPVAFHARKFIAAETRYSTSDKELLAIVDSFKHWRHYLEGSPFEVQVYSDHANLRNFKTTKELNNRQLRWSDELASFSFKITHKAGKLNANADALSRRPDYMDHERIKDRKSTRLNSSHSGESRMPSSA